MQVKPTSIKLVKHKRPNQYSNKPKPPKQKQAKQNNQSNHKQINPTNKCNNQAYKERS